MRENIKIIKEIADISDEIKGFTDKIKGVLDMGNYLIDGSADKARFTIQLKVKRNEFADAVKPDQIFFKLFDRPVTQKDFEDARNEAIKQKREIEEFDMLEISHELSSSDFMPIIDSLLRRYRMKVLSLEKEATSKMDLITKK
jgi:hypothetical protein